MNSPVVVVLDLGFTTLLTTQVIIVAFYSEREKTNKFYSEALISAWGSFTCRKSKISEGNHTQDFYALKKSIDPGFALPCPPPPPPPHASQAAGPRSFPGRIRFLVEVFQGFSLDYTENVRKFGPHSSPGFIWPSLLSETIFIRLRTTTVSGLKCST